MVWDVSKIAIYLLPPLLGISNGSNLSPKTKALSLQRRYRIGQQWHQQMDPTSEQEQQAFVLVIPSTLYGKALVDLPTLPSLKVPIKANSSVSTQLCRCVTTYVLSTPSLTAKSLWHAITSLPDTAFTVHYTLPIPPGITLMYFRQYSDL